MKAVLAPLLFVVLPGLVAGYFLDSYCGQKVTLSDGTESYSYKILNNDVYSSLCEVNFYESAFKRVQLTISGNRLDPQGCSVNVYGNDDVVSLTNGNIVAGSSFSRTVTSNDLGNLYLHVQGPSCADDAYDLTFTVTSDCPSGEFRCSSGQCVYSFDVCDGWDDCDDGSDEDNCFWTTGTEVGIAVGVVFFVVLVSAFAAFFYRRRVMYVRSGGTTALIPSNQTVITSNSNSTVVQSRW